MDNFNIENKISYTTSDKEKLFATAQCFTIDDEPILKLKKNKIYYIKWLKRICVGSVIESV